MILQCFGYRRLSPFYVDAGFLEANTMNARLQAQGAIAGKVNGEKYGSEIVLNADAKRLCVEALKLNVENDPEFHEFVEKMETVVKLLNLFPRGY
jgi:hypothetical protein